MGKLAKTLGKQSILQVTYLAPFFLYSLQQDKSSFLERELRHYCCISREILQIHSTSEKVLNAACCVVKIIIN